MELSRELDEAQVVQGKAFHSPADIHHNEIPTDVHSICFTNQLPNISGHPRLHVPLSNSPDRTLHTHVTRCRVSMTGSKNLLLLFLASSVAYFNFGCLVMVYIILCYSYVNYIYCKNMAAYHYNYYVAILYIISKNMPNITF